MEKINLLDFQKRKLKDFYLVVYVVKKQIKIRLDTCIADKTLYLLWGLDIMGNKQVLGIYFDNPNDNRFWLEKFEDIQARNVKKILFFVTPSNKNIERCIKIVYNGVNIVLSPDDTFSSVTRFWADHPSRKMLIALKDLFLTDNIDVYNTQYDLFKEIYVDNKIVLMMLEKKQDLIKDFYQYTKELRKLFYPYYAIYEMKKFLNKIQTQEHLCTDITQVIEFCLPYINSFERGRTYSKSEWLDLISNIYDQYCNDLEVYLDG